MKRVRKGDIVGRISYGKDILFVVERIIRTKENEDFAILKGLTIRIQADSKVEDLEIIEPKQVEKHVRTLEEKVSKRIQRYANNPQDNTFVREKMIVYTGKILHIDGDSCLDNKNSLLT